MIDVETVVGRLVIGSLVLVVVMGASGVGSAGWQATSTVGPSDRDTNSSIGPEAQTEDGNGTFSVSINVTGEAVVESENGTTYIWPNEPFAVITTVGSGTGAGTAGESGEHAVCLSIELNGSNLERCEPIDTGGSDEFSEEPQTVAFEYDRWPANNSTGPHVLYVAIDGANASGGGDYQRTNTTIAPLEPSGDLDGDGLSNSKERKYGTNVTDTDTDRDGLVDGAEVNEYETDPRTADTDGDGLRDGAEIQRGTDPTKADTDEDGVYDGREDEIGTDPLTADSDNDGLEDGDEMAAGTDPLERDSDGDGIIDGREVAVGTNPLDGDTDGDMVGDALESRLGTGPTDPWVPPVPLVLTGIILLVGLDIWLRRTGKGMTSRLRAGISGFRAGSSGTDSGAASGYGGDGDVGSGSESPPLTDEELVLDLLDKEGGRTKQVQVVEKTDWSKAKVSRVLSRMEKDGDITRIKIGRENLVCLEGHEPQEVKSPFDE